MQISGKWYLDVPNKNGGIFTTANFRSTVSSCNDVDFLVYFGCGAQKSYFPGGSAKLKLLESPYGNYIQYDAKILNPYLQDVFDKTDVKLYVALR